MIYIVILIALASTVALYRYLLPKPIPGDIPYSKLSQKRLMGDLPDILKSVEITKNPAAFLCDQVLKLQSPVVQVWMKPFKKPIVVLSDPQETEDILLRRTKEFDRSQFIEDIFLASIPYHHIVQPTNDQFKAQRKFISDAISPVFLRDIAAPRIRDATLELVELWRLKARIAAGRPSSAHNDIKSAIFDAIWVIAVGDKAGGISTQISFLCEHQSSTTLRLKDDAVIFPMAATPSIVSAINQMVEAFEQIIKSPMPQLHQRILKWFPKLRAAYATKDKALDRMLERSRQRFQDSEKQTRSSALDYFLHRDNQRLSHYSRINIGAVSQFCKRLYLSVYSPTKAYLSAWGNALSIEMPSERLEVEVLTVLSRNTQTGQDTRAATLSRPTSRTFAKAALAKVGCGSAVVVGYFWHAGETALVDLLPEWAQRIPLILVLKPYKGGNLDSELIRD